MDMSNDCLRRGPRGPVRNFSIAFIPFIGAVLLGANATPMLAQPAISAVVNNFSATPAGVPNYGIAEGSLFVIFGSGLANATSPEQSSAPPGLPTDVSGVTVSVTVNGTTEPAYLYYVSPGQIDAVLPSTVPVGTGTVTVNNNGQTASAPIPVVESDFGMLTLTGGNGPAAAYNSSFALISGTSAAAPGQSIILWGSGVGPDPGNDDKTYPQKQNNLANTIPIQVYIGGVSATVVYAGRSQYPGVDQIVVSIPTNITTGCNVSLLVVSGNYVSNSGSIPVASSGSVCSDPVYEFSATQVQTLSAKSAINIGQVTMLLGISQSSSETSGNLEGSFISYTPAQFLVKGFADGFVTYNSCVITPATNTNPTYLNAGTITINGPAGEQSVSPQGTGDYRATLPNGFFPSSGGTFMYGNGAGTSQIGAFTASQTVPAPITPTNLTSLSTVTRSQGFKITWTGGAANTFVAVQGTASGTSNNTNVQVKFRCAAPASAGQLTVPPELLLAVPANSGTLDIYDQTFPVFFSASGMDVGIVDAGYGWAVKTTFE
jgi:uncharacterized protein (TIGR03437 family)